MADEINVGLSIVNPTHDVKLTDKNGRSLGLILTNRMGLRDPRQMMQSAMPRTALRTTQGATGYDDMELPFVAEVQTTWMGGRAQEDFARDRTKYSDGYRMDTTKEYPICGPALISQAGVEVEQLELGIPSTVEDYSPSGAVYAFTYKMTAAKTINGFYLNFSSTRPSSNTYNYSIYDGGVIDELSDIETLAPAANNNSGSKLQYSLNMLNNTSGWVYFPTHTISVDENHWVLIILKSVGAFPHLNKATIATSDVYYTMYSPAEWTGVLGDEHLVPSIRFLTSTTSTFKFFEYKRQLYCIKNPNSGAAPSLYINGFRGAADANTGDLGSLVDATQTTVWASDAIKDCIALIINGPGEMEMQPWRRISASISGKLSVSTPWKVTHSTSTEYVILGSNTWTEITGHELTGTVTDIAIVKDYVVFAQGDAIAIRFMREYNNAGTWTRQWGGHASNNGAAADEAIYADLFAVGQLTTGETVLWRARSDDSKVDWTFVGDWDVTGETPLGTMFFFDINIIARREARLLKSRSIDDEDLYKADADPNLTLTVRGYDRMQNDATYSITSTATESETGDNNVVSHRFLPYYVTCGDISSNITGLVMYGTPPMPYVLKEDSIGSIYNNIYAEIPISELKVVRAEENGKANMQYGVYLYFNLAGGLIERYFDQRLDNVGYTLGEGLPRIRQGEVSKLLQYPGRFYASNNAGVNGISSILCSNELGWHEIYRSAVAGQEITDIHIQTIPGFDNADRFWFSEGSELRCFPIAINPLQQIDYTYFGYGTGSDRPYIETSWIDFELKDIYKYFNSVTIFSDYPNGEIKSGNEYSIYVYYKIDNDYNWTLAGKGRAVPSQDILISKTYNKAGKKIKFKIELQPQASSLYTPRLKAVVVNGVLRMPVKQSWMLTFDLDPKTDLQERLLSNAQGTTYTWIKAWANSVTSPTPLTMRTNDYMTDNHVVFIDPASISTVNVIIDPNDRGTRKEFRHIGSITVYEVANGST